jgi:hypothetical protein
MYLHFVCFRVHIILSFRYKQFLKERKAAKEERKVSAAERSDYNNLYPPPPKERKRLAKEASEMEFEWDRDKVMGLRQLKSQKDIKAEFKSAYKLMDNFNNTVSHAHAAYY